MLIFKRTQDFQFITLEQNLGIITMSGNKIMSPINYSIRYINTFNKYMED